MTSDLQANWPSIVRFFNKCMFTPGYFTFATAGHDGWPHTAPYGSLFLRDDCNGYYSDVFPNRMSANLKNDNRICIMAVNFGIWYMLKGLFRGRFDRWPGIRLYGNVDKSRTALPEELDRFRSKVKRFRRLKGYDLLWRDIRTVRDIHFTHFEPVYLGAMTRHLNK